MKSISYSLENLTTENDDTNLWESLGFSWDTDKNETVKGLNKGSYYVFEDHIVYREEDGDVYMIAFSEIESSRNEQQKRHTILEVFEENCQTETVKNYILDISKSEILTAVRSILKEG